MSNISGQLIKDSFNYVLQSDLITGVVYRIGGSIAENPKFISGLTVNTSFTYSDGSEFPGYVLTCDAAGNAVWGPVSGATSGVVVTGGTFDYSAGTLTLVLSNGVNVPISGLEDIYVTGGVVSGNSIVFSYNDTNTFEVSGITSFDTFTSYTASTEQILNSKVDNTTFNQFAQDTNIALNNRVEITTFTAYTATTQPLILNSVTGGTYSGGTLYLVNNSGTTIPISGFTTGGTSTTDSYVTGFSINNETITLSQNRTDQYSAFNISLSGYVTNNIFSSYTASTQANINNKLDISGFTAYTATTQPLILNSVTGGSFNNSTKTLTLINNSGGTVPITGFTDTFLTGGTYANGSITFTNNLGGGFVVSGLSTTSGGSVSGLSYYVSASTPNNVTLISGDRWFNTDTGVEVVWIDDGDSQQWIQPFSVPGPLSPDVGYYATTGITTGQTLTWDKTYWGISGSTNINLILPTTTSKDGYFLIVKDEAGICGSYRIRITPSSGLIDGNDYVDMNINYMSLTLMVRGGNWFLI